jgi:hypothetical protein
MQHLGARLAFLSCLLGFVSRIAAAPPAFVPCDDLPQAVVALARGSEIEAFGIAPTASVAVAAIVSPGDKGRSVLRFARGEDEPREVRLAGRVLGLAVTPDGKVAYAIVRVNDRKGAARSVDILRLDLDSGRTTVGATLPATAGGLAVGDRGTTLLVASRNELRTFVLPGLASGPLYRALGENIGVAPMPGSSFVLLAQTTRVVLADLSASQDRDGLALAEEAAAPVPLTGMLASTGDLGPIVLSRGGPSWCVRAGAPPAPAPAPSVEAPPVAEPAAQEPRVDTAPAVAVAQANPPAPNEPVVPPPVSAAPSARSEPGTVIGGVDGPSVADVAAIVFLGPDNVLHEAARAAPDEKGRYEAVGLPPGTYRIVAAGKEGRVLICQPPFITIQVGAHGAVEAPVLKVVSAQ